VSPTRTRTREPDQASAEAVDLARDALTAVVGAAQVGAHLGVQADGERIVTHLFQSADPAYAGWRWAVTVARAPRSKVVTVSETVLLPGPASLLAPDWVPWHERLRPGDLGVGDLLPTKAGDDRLVPAYLLSDDPAVEAVAFELGLGRVRVMSALGRDDAAERWYAGDGGPDTAIATHAPGRCATCGFYLPIEGSLRAVFGVCGNAFSPRDGAVVSADAGCGAHSEAVVEQAATPSPPPAYDDGVDIERA
jgi:hypothetical protein